MLNDETFPIKPSTIETVDTGFYEHVSDSFNIHTISNGGFVKVPVLWIGPERAFQVKSNPLIRDNVGKLKLPLISIERTSIQKDPSFKGVIQADIRNQKIGGTGYKGGAFRVVTRINQEKTSQIQNNRNRGIFGVNQGAYPDYGTEIVYDNYFVPVPTYVAITYSIVLRSEYQQQMNQMVTPFITRTGQVNHFVFKKDNHKFEAFIQQDFAQTNNISNLAEDERSFQTKIDVKVLGYLIGEDTNEERPMIVKRETVVKVQYPIEVVLNNQTIPNSVTERVLNTSSTASGNDAENSSAGSSDSSLTNKENLAKSLAENDVDEEDGEGAASQETKSGQFSDFIALFDEDNRISWGDDYEESDEDEE